MTEGRDQKTKGRKNMGFHRKKVSSSLYCLVNLILSTIGTLRLIAIQVVCGILAGSKKKNHSKLVGLLGTGIISRIPFSFLSRLLDM